MGNERPLKKKYDTAMHEDASSSVSHNNSSMNTVEISSIDNNQIKNESSFRDTNAFSILEKFDDFMKSINAQLHDEKILNCGCRKLKFEIKI